jgi:methylated-DNA-[protein]-cysteine S-methyltransferase
MAHHLFQTDFGVCGIAWSDAGTSAFLLPESSPKLTEARLMRLSGSTEPAEAPAWVAALVTAVQRHLSGDFQSFAKARLDWTLVSEFQRRIYEAARRIPPGETLTYGGLATSIGLKPGAARAVGRAMATNPWPLLIPCHRVLGAGGKLTGFSAAGGTRTKARLLSHEGCAGFTLA